MGGCAQQMGCLRSGHFGTGLYFCSYSNAEFVNLNSFKESPQVTEWFCEPKERFLFALCDFLVCSIFKQPSAELMSFECRPSWSTDYYDSEPNILRRVRICSLPVWRKSKCCLQIGSFLWGGRKIVWIVYSLWALKTHVAKLVFSLFFFIIEQYFLLHFV